MGRPGKLALKKSLASMTLAVSLGAAPDYYPLREPNRVFKEVAALNPVTTNWTGVERPEQLDAAAVTPSFFRAMGVQPPCDSPFAMLSRLR